MELAVGQVWYHPKEDIIFDITKIHVCGMDLKVGDDVSKFGMDCEFCDDPVLYWEEIQRHFRNSFEYIGELE